MAFQTIVLGLSLLPGFIWLFFFWEEDDRPEPKRLIALVFFMGMVSAIVIALLGLALKQQFFGAMTDLSLPYLFAASLLEEVGKFVFVFLLVHRLADFDEPVDAMIYMVIGALGFATLENIAYLSQEAGHNQMLDSVAKIASLRFVGSTLLHALSSAVVGYFWALSIRHFKKPGYIIIGLALAVGLHTYFNYLIITYGSISFVLPLLLVAGFFVLSDFEELKWRSV
jgi:RsiW-degrading membrane proteinase PrsW (M82 family)